MINKKIWLSIGLLGLGILLIVRLIFFLPDRANKSVESILIHTIYLGSILLMLWWVLWPLENIKSSYEKYKDCFFFGALLLLLDTTFMMKHQLDYARIHVFSMVFTLFLVIVISLYFPSSKRRVFDVIVLAVYGVYLFAQDVYFRIFNTLFSFKEIVNVREGMAFSDDMYRFSWFHGLLIIVMLSYLIFSANYFKPTADFQRKAMTRPIFMSGLFLLALINLNASYPVKQARLHTSDHYLYQSVFSRTDFVSRFGTLQLFARDLLKSITPVWDLGQNSDWLDDYFLQYPRTFDDHPMRHVFEGMNLIYIVGESFDHIAVDPVLTPNLYWLKTNSYDFTNHYTPVYPRTTCDTEIILNTGLVPSIEDGPTCYVYNENEYKTSLATLFNQAGYLTQAFHNNYKEFYTRQLVYQGFGYDHLYGQHELNLSETDIRFDSIFFDQAESLVLPEDTPFFSFILTLSGHSPYTDVNLAVREHYEVVDEVVGDTWSEPIKHYVAAQMELDIMVGNIFKALDTHNLWDNTVVILTSDHYPYTLDQDAYTAFIGTDSLYEKQRTPLYIWSSTTTHEVIERLSSSFDLLPSIISLFNLEGDLSHYVGTDFFSEVSSMVLFQDYTFLTETDHIALSDSHNLENITYIERASRYYEMSRRALRSNYFKR